MSTDHAVLPRNTWEPFSPSTVAEILDGLAVPWCVAGGWAIDLLLGRTTRAHRDIEIAIPDDSFRLVAQHFDQDDVEVLAPDGERKTHAYVRNSRTGANHLEIIRDPHEGEVWTCPINSGLRMPYSQLIRQGRTGIPYQRPEVALLFKAGTLRPKDHLDLEHTTQTLNQGGREWLRKAIASTYGAAHPWLAPLTSPSPS